MTGPKLYLLKKVSTLNFDIDNLKQLIKQSYFESEQDTLGVDEQGFIVQTLRAILNAIEDKDGCSDFWIISNADKSLGGFMLASFVYDIDNKLTYWVNQVYVCKEHRGWNSFFRKEVWRVITERAKIIGVKHIVLVTSRKNTPAYCRLMGKQYHQYAALIKEDI